MTLGMLAWVTLTRLVRWPRMRRSMIAVVTLLLFAGVAAGLGHGRPSADHRAARSTVCRRSCKPFFVAQREFIAEHSVDPDLWRVVGSARRARRRGSESLPRHRRARRPRPFTNVPRDWKAFVAKYGAERANRMGRLPWRAEEIYRLLVTRFRGHRPSARRPTPPTTRDISRGARALHRGRARAVPRRRRTTTASSPDQRGIHSRFETEARAAQPRSHRSWRR